MAENVKHDQTMDLEGNSPIINEDKMFFVDDCENGCWIVQCQRCAHIYHDKAGDSTYCPCCAAPNHYPPGASW